WMNPRPGKILLAVLAFENLNGDPQEGYFCDGLTDEMINKLGRVFPPKLWGIATTFTMQKKKKPKSVEQIRGEVGVGYILETSVRRQRNQVRIATQLIQVRDQSTLWSEAYDYNVASVFSLETDIPQRIASSLALQLLPAQQVTKSQTTSVEAY